MAFLNRREFLRISAAIAGGAFAASVLPEGIKAQGPDNQKRLFIYYFLAKDTVDGVADRFGTKRQMITDLNPWITKIGFTNMQPGYPIILPGDIAVGGKTSNVVPGTVVELPKPQPQPANNETGTFWKPDSLAIEQPNKMTHEDLYFKEPLMPFGRGVNERWFRIDPSSFENGKYRLTLAVGAAQKTVMDGVGGSLKDIGVDNWGTEKLKELRVAIQESSKFPPSTTQGHEGTFKEDKNFNGGEAAKVINFQLRNSEPNAEYYIRIFNNSVQDGKPVWPVIRAFLVQN